MAVRGTNLVISLQALAGHALMGSNVIGSINFQSSTTQPSGYVNIPITSLTAYKPGGIAFGNSILTPGQVAVVNGSAILQAAGTNGPSRTLTVLGKPGVNYQVQYCTNFAARGGWYPLTTYNQTNISQVISVGSSMPNAYYRVQQQ